MRALVIGATGQVGGELMRQLRAQPTEIVVGTCRSRALPGLVPLDITDGGATRALIGEVRPTVIFLPAALTAVDYCELHQEEAWRSNVRGPTTVARAAAAAGAKLVFYSTEYVFDGERGPYREDDPVHPLGVYAQTKAEAERVVRETLEDHLILRTTVVYGWDPASINFAMQVWKRLSAGEPMKVPSDQIGNPTLVDFLVECTLELVARDVRGIVNVVGCDRVPRSEFGVRLACALGLDERLIQPTSTGELMRMYPGMLAPRPLNAGLRTDRLSQLLGRPAIGLDAALSRLVARKSREM